VEKFVFPKSVLEQINECSNGGFILFNFDIDRNPQIFSNFDDSMSALALQNYIDICSKTFQNINYQVALSEATSQNSGEDDEVA
jgi:hypothetical protein